MPRTNGMRAPRRRGVLTVRVKILGTVLIASATALVAGVAGIWQITTVAARGHTIYTDTVLPDQDVGQLREAVGRARMDGLSRANAKTSDAKAQYGKALEADEAAIDTIAATYGRRNLTQPQRRALEDFLGNWREYRKARADADQLAAQGRAVEFEQLRATKLTPTVNAALAALDKLSKQAKSLASQRVRAADEARTRGLWIITLVLVIGVLVAFTLGFVTARTLLRPLRRLRSILNAMAEGDLTQRVGVPGNDEVGEMLHAFEGASERIRSTISAVQSNSGQLATRSTDLSDVSRTLADTTAAVAEQINHAAAATSQVSHNLNSVATGTEELGASVGEIGRAATVAAQVGDRAVSVARHAETVVARLGSSSAEIGAVVQAITSISEQTNLLALNATIEAARAGDAGKGFAVVAGEVKDLAQEANQAASEIAKRVEAIQADTSEAVGAIDEITRVISEIEGFQTTIASAVEEQSVTTSSMARLIVETAASTESITHSFERITATVENSNTVASSTRDASANLREMSQELNRLVSAFKH